MKKIKTISLLAMGAVALSIYASDFLYFCRNGEVTQIVPAESVDRFVKGTGDVLVAVDADGNEIYSFSPEELDSIAFAEPLPKADLLDVVFNADGTAEDVSPMKFKVERGGEATAEWSDAYGRYVAKLSDNKWGNGDVAEQFYRVDYSGNQAFKDALADGHTLEVLFMPEYTTLPDSEAKVFASHEAGGTGIMFKGTWSGPNKLNALTFLPNVSTGTNSSWQWAASDVVPESGKYYHVVGVWDKDAKKARIYINGELNNEIDISGSNFIQAKEGANFFCIGGDACVVGGNKTTGVQNGINGRVVVARIYDDPLTAEQAGRLYKAVDVPKPAPLPKADLLDVVFNADGTAEDVSPMKFKVERGGEATAEWSDAYGRYVAKLSDNKWGNGDVAEQFYRVDYSGNQAFKDALADGHTLEVLFMPEYTTLPDSEAKVFASHEAGGTGIMFKGTWSGPNKLNALTFLPNVSTGTNSSWQWAASDVVPESGKYYHVVGVWDKDAKKARIYINGELNNEIDISGSNFIQAKDGASFFCIGGDACVPGGNKTTGVQNGINGRVVVARIYDDALTAEQAGRLYEAVDVKKPAPLPKADLLDVVFNADGVAEDVSPMKFKVERGGEATTEWSDAFNRYVAKLSDNKWGNSDVAEQFYRVDYSGNQAFKDALADGHTLEVLFMPAYTGNIQNVEAKIFASHEAGGTGIMVKTSWTGPNGLNALTFLPNVSTGTNSSWQWAASDVVPEPYAYYHIIGVWDKDAQKARIYVNGELKNEISISGTNFILAKDGANYFCLGGDACVPGGNKTTGVQNGINGQIVLARIYDDALTAEQAELLYKDVEEGVAASHPVIENLTLLENVQVKAGAVYPIYGTGFEDGDIIIFENASNRWELPAKKNEGESVNVILPDDVKSGNYSVMLKRGERSQFLGTVDFLRVKNFESRAHIVAHRGYWAKAGAAQNSRTALRYAIDLKAYGSETDIWLTKDNVLVINHDPSIGGVTIQDSNYDDIKDKTLSNGEVIPTFADYLEILKESDYCKLIVEVKTHSTEARTIEAAKAAVEAVKAAGLEDKAEYIAFDYATCKALASTYPGIKVQFLCDRSSEVRTPAQLNNDGGISIDYNGNMLSSNPTFIDDAHKLGLVVNVWTIRSNSEIGEWITKGVDFITTDIPDLGMKYIEYYDLNK